MKYAKRATEEFAKLIDKEECLELMDTLIIKEGYTETTTTFNGDDIVLNMDCVEAGLAANDGRLLNKSMDAAFIIEDLAGASQEIVFAEFKLRFTGMRNLRPEDLTDKISGSTSALGNPPNIHGNHYFVFHSKHKEEARRKMYRLAPRFPPSHIAMNMEDLKQAFFE
ncbi:hypothetical protein [Chitinophaga ginsengisoli]|uniref:Uncharacterized protein n=1 Tax=Chitinophaga ginsengisoli TaxID=363837 RepID=A0A2P8GKS6_9BACT|nr:hypothetical protein [Chitinophaga ginsengisoli]PSL34569.1 hypothetical protein CLV42_102141 [Chitinophaga ginsengisoli]